MDRCQLDPLQSAPLLDGLGLGEGASLVIVWAVDGMGVADGAGGQEVLEVHDAGGWGDGVERRAGGRRRFSSSSFIHTCACMWQPPQPPPPLWLSPTLIGWNRDSSHDCHCQYLCTLYVHEGTQHDTSFHEQRQRQL